ncbi:O-antigen ligase family protein [Nocardioides dongkuii]|uniref:O-antigen ligase family protein n=1 Tax=Nocardioides dongkuii TaxID=2760089 RepID=UPI0015FD00D2|nr:O-antigen ligase family protein [Nocardioides dongkuii]
MVIILHVGHVFLRPDSLLVTCVVLDVLLLSILNSVLVPAELRIPVLVVVLGASLTAVLSARLHFRVAAAPFLGALTVGTVLSQFFGRGGDEMIQVAVMLALGAVAACLAASLSSADWLEVAQSVAFLGVVQVAIAIGAEVFDIGWVQITFAAADPTGAGRAAYGASPNLILPGGWSRSSGTLGHPIPFALFLLAGLCLALRVQGIARREIRWATVSLLSAGLLLSGSRTTIFIALALAAIFAASVGRRLWRALALILAVPVGAVVVYGFGAFALQNARERSSFSLDFRLQAWETFVNLFNRDLVEVLIGSGPSSAGELQEEGYVDLQGLQSIDNQVVTTFADLGLLGLSIFMVLLSVTILRRNRPEWFALAALWGMFLSFDVFGWHIFVFLFWFFVEMVLKGPTGPSAHDPAEAELVDGDVDSLSTGRASR